jgi:transposase
LGEKDRKKERKRKRNIRTSASIAAVVIVTGVSSAMMPEGARGLENQGFAVTAM